MQSPKLERSFCSHCRSRVHDVSAMTPRELRRFLRANLGRSVCVSYRAAPDGTIVMRPEPRPLGVVLVTLGLAACTGYAPEIEHPDELCRDASGYEIDCRAARDRDVRLVPDDDASRPIDHSSRDAVHDAPNDREDEPTDAPAWGAADGPSIPIEGMRAVPPSRPREVEATDDPYRQASFGDEVVRGLFYIDPDRSADGQYIPTAELLEDLRERNAERREQRDARRAARRERRSTAKR